MSEEIVTPVTEQKDGGNTEENVTDVKAESSSAETKNTEHMIPKTRLDEEIQKRKEIEKEAKANAARLKELETADEERKKAAMTKEEQLQKEVTDLMNEKAELLNKQKETERRELQREVAKEVGLPDGLAARLRGETKDEITEDAKAMLELLPKQDATPEKKVAPKTQVINPSDGKKGETLAQQKARLGMGGSVNTFDLSFAKSHGGGASEAESKE